MKKILVVLLLVLASALQAQTTSLVNKISVLDTSNGQIFQTWKSGTTDRVGAYSVMLSSNSAITTTRTWSPLAIWLDTATKYKVHLHALTGSSSVPGIKGSFHFPTGATMNIVQHGPDSLNTSTSKNAVITADSTDGFAFNDHADSTGFMDFDGVISTSSPGYFYFMTVKNTSGVGVLRALSYMECIKEY